MGNQKMTVAEWIDRYYKPDRLHLVPGRRGRIIADRENDLRLHGEAMISKHDSVTGKRVILYNPTWRPESYLRWCVSLSEVRGQG